MLSAQCEPELLSLGAHRRGLDVVTALGKYLARCGKQKGQLVMTTQGARCHDAGTCSDHVCPNLMPLALAWVFPLPRMPLCFSVLSKSLPLAGWTQLPFPLRRLSRHSPPLFGVGDPLLFSPPCAHPCQLEYLSQPCLHLLLGHAQVGTQVPDILPSMCSGSLFIFSIIFAEI